MSYLDFQLLLYVPSEQYEPCRTFYEQVFATQPFYGWDEGPAPYISSCRCRLWRISIPGRRQPVPSPRSLSSAPTAGICSAWLILREITSIFIRCQPPPNKAHRNRKN